MEFQPDLDKLNPVQDENAGAKGGPPPKNNVALISMILGLGGLFFMGSLIGLIPAILAVILGIAALRQKPQAKISKGYAISGLIAGGIGLAFFAALLGMYAYLTNTLGAPHTENMERIVAGAQQYADEHNNILPKDIAELYPYTKFSEGKEVTLEQLQEKYEYFYIPLKLGELTEKELLQVKSGIFIVYTKESVQIPLGRFMLVMNLDQQGGFLHVDALPDELQKQEQMIKEIQQAHEPANIASETIPEAVPETAPEAAPETSGDSSQPTGETGENASADDVEMSGQTQPPADSAGEADSTEDTTDAAQIPTPAADGGETPGEEQFPTE